VLRLDRSGVSMARVVDRDRQTTENQRADVEAP
jgi:hypothetical protein